MGAATQATDLKTYTGTYNQYNLYILMAFAGIQIPLQIGLIKLNIIMYFL